jgi:Holliday junction resolvasome RuvABC endonuclease subunit
MNEIIVIPDQLKYIIGIDPGRINYGLCIYSIDQNRVVTWKNIDTEIDTYNTVEVTTKIFLMLDHHLSGIQFEDLHFVIETQPFINNGRSAEPFRIKSIEVATIAFALSRKITIHQVNPRTIATMVKASDLPRAQRKKRGVEFVKEFIDSNPLRFENSCILGWVGKKDDMADAFLLVNLHLNQ